MPRTIMDDAFRRWEAYATTGDYGFAVPGRIIFRCLTDPEVRARSLTIEGDKSDAEQAVAVRSDDELRRMLGEAPEIG